MTANVRCFVQPRLGPAPVSAPSSRLVRDASRRKPLSLRPWWRC